MNLNLSADLWNAVMQHLPEMKPVFIFMALIIGAAFLIESLPRTVKFLLVASIVAFVFIKY